MKKRRILSLILAFAMIASMIGTMDSKSYAYNQSEITKALGIIYQTDTVKMQGIKIKKDSIDGSLINDELTFTLFDATAQEPCGELKAKNGELEPVDLIKGHHYIIWLKESNSWRLKGSQDTLGPGKRYFSLNQDVNVDAVAGSDNSTLPRDDKNYNTTKWPPNKGPADFPATNADANPDRPQDDNRLYMCCLVLEAGETKADSFRVPVGLDPNGSDASVLTTVITEDGAATDVTTSSHQGTQEEFDITEIEQSTKIKLVNQYDKVDMEQDDYFVEADVWEDLNYAVVFENADDLVMLSNLITVKDHSEQGTKRLTYTHYTCSSVGSLFFATKNQEYYDETDDLQQYKNAIENCTYSAFNSYSSSDLNATLDGVIALIGTDVKINASPNNDEFLFYNRKLNNFTVTDSKVAGKSYDVIDFDCVNMHRYEICKLPAGDYTITTALPAGRSASDVEKVYYIDTEDNNELKENAFIVSGDNIAIQTTSVGCYNNVIVYKNTGSGSTQIGGTASIQGIPNVGQTLTAFYAGNASQSSSYSYQWYANDGEINGATNRTYKLTEAEKGKTIKVRVTGTGSFTGYIDSPATAEVGEAGSGGNPPSPGAPSVTPPAQEIPVIGDTDAKVEVNVSGDTATIGKIDDTTLDTIVSDDSTKTDITLDMSALSSAVTGAVLPTETAETIADVLNDKANNKTTLEIKLPNATVQISAKALESVVIQAKGETIELVVNNKSESDLNNNQKEQLSNKTVEKTFEAYFTSGKNRISNFNGGKVTVGKIDFSVPAGKNPKYYHVEYLPTSGPAVRHNTWFKNGVLYFDTTHFSDYVIVYDESVENGGPSDAQIAKNTLSINKKLKVSQTGKKVNVAWGKVDGADEYAVYASYCGKALKKVKTVTDPATASFSFSKLDGKAIDLTKNIKVVVKAFANIGDERQECAKSIAAHVIGVNSGKYSNPKSITLAKKDVTLKVGKTHSIKANVNLVDSSKTALPDSHVKKFRYASNNKAVATVNAAGKITAKKKGTATIYVYAANGCAKSIKVTVK